MKSIIIVMFSFLFFCSGSEFELLESTSQKWSGGTAYSGAGIKYRINLKVNKSSKDLTFDKLWIGDKCIDMEVAKGKIYRSNVEFSKNDTITILANRITIPQKERREGKIVTKDLPKENCGDEKIPYEYKGEALIGYLYKGKRKYFEVKEVKELEPLRYP